MSGIIGLSPNMKSGVVSQGLVGKYPIGHVIQTKYTSYNSTNSDVATSGSVTKVVDGGNYHWKGNITPTSAVNDVLISMAFAINIHSTTANAVGARLCIFRDVASPASGTSGTNIWETKDHGLYYHISGLSATFNNFIPYAIEYLDTAPGVADHYYYLGYSAYGSNVTINGVSTYQPFTCILQEIQR